jgi:hypothetical protein
MVLQADGNLCVYYNYTSGYCSFTHDANCPGQKGAQYMQVTNNGQLVIYNSDSVAIWMTPVPNGQTQKTFTTSCCFYGGFNAGYSMGTYQLYKVII